MRRVNDPPSRLLRLRRDPDLGPVEHIGQAAHMGHVESSE